MEQETLLLASDASPGALEAADWVQTHWCANNRKIVVVTVVTEGLVNMDTTGEMPISGAAATVPGLGSGGLNTIGGVGLIGVWVMVPPPARDHQENYSEHWAKGHEQLKATTSRLHGFASVEGIVQSGKGSAADGIMHTILDVQPTLVAIGRRGMNRVERWVLGSVSQAVVARSAVPVLVVPDHGRVL